MKKTATILCCVNSTPQAFTLQELSCFKKRKRRPWFKPKSVGNLGLHFLTLKPSRCQYHQVSTISMDMHLQNFHFVGLTRSLSVDIYIYFPGNFSALGNQKQIQRQLYKRFLCQKCTKGARFQGKKIIK